MTNKRELELEIAELQGEVVRLKVELQKEKIIGKRIDKEITKLKEELKIKQMVFLTVDVSNYPSTAQDSLQKQLQEQVDKEFERIGIDMDVVILPSIVKNIQFHETKKVK